MEGWRKMAVGALLGVAGTIYATDEEARRRLPKAARELPGDVRRRFSGAVAAGREASARRREEILSDLDGHGGSEEGRRPRRDGVEPEPGGSQAPGLPPEDAAEPTDTREAVARGGRTEGG